MTFRDEPWYKPYDETKCSFCEGHDTEWQASGGAQERFCFDCDTEYNAEPFLDYINEQKKARKDYNEHLIDTLLMLVLNAPVFREEINILIDRLTEENER